jgi:hypothetical protein
LIRSVLKQGSQRKSVMSDLTDEEIDEFLGQQLIKHEHAIAKAYQDNLVFGGFCLENILTDKEEHKE